MRKLAIPTIFLLLSSITLIAQNDTVKYEVVRDNPYDIPNMYIRVSPLNMTYVSDFSLCLESDVQYEIANLINLRGRYELQYPIDLEELLFGGLLGDGYKYPKAQYNHFDFGIDLKTADKKRTDNGTVLLRSNSSRSTNVTIITNELIQTKFEHRRINRVRLGVAKYQMNFKRKNDQIITIDGTIFGEQTEDGEGITYTDVNYQNLDTHEGSSFKNTHSYSRENEDLMTEMNISMAYIGFSISSISNKIINVEDYGLRGIANYSTMYFDFIVGKPELMPFQFYESNPNATVYGDEIGSSLIDYKIDVEKSDIKFIPVGFRIGAVKRTPLFSKSSGGFENRTKRVEKSIYMSTSYELGILPSYGLKRGWFVSLGFSIDIHPI